MPDFLLVFDNTDLRESLERCRHFDVNLLTPSDPNARRPTANDVHKERSKLTRLGEPKRRRRPMERPLRLLLSRI